MLRLPALTLALIFAATTASAAFMAAVGLRVSGPAQDFEVFGRSAGSRVFCAAGEYARRVLGAAMNDRVVLTRAYGPSPTQPNQLSVGFELKGPEGGTDWGGGVLLLTTKRGVGMNRTVGHAVFLCNDT